MSAAITLRPKQQSFVEDVGDLYRAIQSVLGVAPTGFGKTVCFAHIAMRALAKGKRVLILAHRRELIRQASRKLTECGVPHGVIMPGVRPTRDAVQVGSVQTLARRLDDLPQFDLIVIDEAHHAIAGQWDRIIQAQPRAKLLGVTATPERLDGRGLGREAGGCFDRMVVGPSVADLVADGFLTASRIYAPAEAPDLTGVRTKGGDFDADQLEQRLNVATITGDVLAHWRRLAAGQPTIAFCISVQHAQDVAATFRAAGIRAVCAHGSMALAERDAAINGLATGATQVLTTCDLISEGLDVPAVGACILLRPTKSLVLFLQQIGRGLRPVYPPGLDLATAEARLAAIAASNKPHLIVLDHAGCTGIHGLPDAPREWTLLGRPKGVKAPDTWQCPSCYAVQAPAKSCCACDYVEPPAQPSDNGPREIVQAEGELVEVNMSRVEQLRAAPLRDLLAADLDEAGLREIARAKGYHPRWVTKQLELRRNCKAIRWDARFGPPLGQPLDTGAAA